MPVLASLGSFKKDRSGVRIGEEDIQSSAYVDVVLREGTNVPRSFVMVNDFFMVESGERRRRPEIPYRTKSWGSKHCGAAKIMQTWGNGGRVEGMVTKWKSDFALNIHVISVNIC